MKGRARAFEESEENRRSLRKLVRERKKSIDKAVRGLGMKPAPTCSAKRASGYVEDVPWTKKRVKLWLRCCKRKGHRGKHRTDTGTEWPRRAA